MKGMRRFDVMTQEQRSRCMSRIQGRNTGPELMLRRALWRRGWRYRVRTKLLGRPDLVFRKRMTVIFIDGCFWHGCPRHGVSPKANSVFWERKLRANVMRDRRVTKSLRKEGWVVLRFWEHDVENRLERILSATESQLREVQKDKNAAKCKTKART